MKTKNEWLDLTVIWSSWMHITVIRMYTMIFIGEE